MYIDILNRLDYQVNRVGLVWYLNWTDQKSQKIASLL